MSREAFLEQLRTATEVTCLELTRHQKATVGEACGNEWFKVFRKLVLERSDEGLPRLGGGGISSRFRYQYFNKFKVYPYDLLSLEDIQSKKYLAALRNVVIEDRERQNKWHKLDKLNIRAQEALEKADETLKRAQKQWKSRLQKCIRNSFWFLDKGEGYVLHSESSKRYTLRILQAKPFTKLRRRRRWLKKFIREMKLFLFDFGFGEGTTSQSGEDEGAEGDGRVLCDDTDSDTTEMSERSDDESESKNGRQHEACIAMAQGRSVKMSEVESEVGADVGWEDGGTDGWEEHVEDLIAYEIEREKKMKEWSAQKLAEAREQLILDPRFKLLPREKQKWVYMESPQFDCSQDENKSIEGSEMIVDGFSGSKPPFITPVLGPGQSGRPFTHIQTSPLLPPGILALISAPPGANSSTRPHAKTPPYREPYTAPPPIGAPLKSSAAGFTHAHGQAIQPQSAARQTGSFPFVAGASGPAWVGSSQPLGQLVPHFNVNEEVESVLPHTPRPRHVELAPSEPSSLAYSQPSFRSPYVQKSPVQPPPRLLWERPERTPENEWQFGIVVLDVR